MILTPLDHYETKEYHRLTRGMAVEFMILPTSFMAHCDQVIYGNEYSQFRYFCFHLHSDTYYKNYFSELCKVVEIVHGHVERRKYPNLANNTANLLILLKEPEARKKDKEYQSDNKRFWREMVWDDELLMSKKEFKKYVME